MDAGGRATQDAKAEEGILCGINDRLSTKKRKRGREKWISGGALKSLSNARQLLNLSAISCAQSATWS